MHSLAAKIISLSALFLVTFIAGLLPLKLRRKREEDGDDRRWTLRDLRRKQLVSLCTCFAGGAFFASSMLELLPTVQEDFKAVFKSANINMNYPIGEFGISIGFFFILTVEQIIHVVKEKSPHGHSHSHGLIEDSSTDPLLQDRHTPSNGVEGTSSHQRTQDSGVSDSDDDPSPSAVALGNGHQIGCPEHQHAEPTPDNLKKSGDQANEQSVLPDVNKKHHNHRHYLRSYLLLIALSVHALFEGLAVGLFQDVDHMVELLGALIIHKCILGFSIGINLVQHSFPASMVARSSFIFSAMSPVGVGIGILMLTYASTSLGRIFSAIFQAIATGTFLYVTFFEIFFHELNSKECHRMLKVLTMVLGYALIAVVQYFENRVE